MSYKTDFAWSQECDYISSVTDACLHKDRAESHPKMASFNHDRDCFVRYCEMQQACATRDGKHDVAEYIGHCLDDLRDRAS